MQHYVRTSRSRYEEALAKKRKASAQEDKRRKERKRAADQIKQLKVNKARLATAAAAETKTIDSEIAELEKAMTR